MAAIIGAFIVIVVVAILVNLTSVAAEPARKNGCAAGFQRLTAGVRFQSLKIAVVSWQIITQVSGPGLSTFLGVPTQTPKRLAGVCRTWLFLERNGVRTRLAPRAIYSDPVCANIILEREFHL